ncbi:MAG TPA: 50S ribosomal protein L9 [Bdellovibrionota bacterium]|nr:50S ribosomal protein L9 [Bdellovibrionota bacterium]
MKVILKNSYMSLGEAGEIVEVKPGYARNFLIPQGIAVSATTANLRLVADQGKAFEAKKLQERDNSKQLLEKLNGLSGITIEKKVSDDGRLYGSVTAKDIEEALAKAGAAVDRRMIVLGQQIKMAGEYKVLVRLVGGLKTQVPVAIVSDAPKKNVVEA